MKNTRRPLPSIYEDFLASFQQKLKSDGSPYSPRTVESYRSGLYLIYDFFVEGIDQITQERIQKFSEHLATRRFEVKKDVFREGMTWVAINHRIGILRSFLQYLESEKGYTFEEFIYPKAKIMKKRFLEYVLYPSDIQRLLKATRKFEDLESEAIIMVLAYAGLRAQELVELPRTFLSEGKHLIGKGGKRRRVFIGDEVKESIQEYLEGREDDDPRMFPLSKTTVHRRLKYYAGQARLKKTKVYAHAFRHFCAKYLLEERGFPLNYVQAVLGHESIDTTGIYLAPTAEEIEKRMNVKDKRLRKEKRARKKKKNASSKPRKGLQRRIRKQRTQEQKQGGIS